MDIRANASVDTRPNSTGPNVLDAELVGLLAAVEQEDPYYEPASPKSPKYERLCKLESLGYIRYCPYPEEFWVMLPAGRDFLSRAVRSEYGRGDLG